MGQRYDMIVEAKTNPTADSYWMRSIWQSTCNANGNPKGILGVVRYKAGSTALPTTTGPSYPDACGDEPYASLVPHLPVNAGRNGALTTLNLGATFVGVLKWTFNNSSLNLNWSDPTNLRIANHQAVFPTDYNVYPLPAPDEWVYLAISDHSGGPPFHTIHLHGHDSLVLAQGNGTYSPANVTLNFHNPPRRDTVTLASGGHLVLAFRTDNPGSWLMHCHVAWHASGGMSVQFVEREREIPKTIRRGSVKCLTKACENWDRYSKQKGATVQIDSGI